MVISNNIKNEPAYQLEALTSLFEQISTRLDVSDTLKIVITQGGSLINASRCSIFLVNVENNSLDYVLGRGLSTDYILALRHTDRHALDWQVYYTGRPIMIEDLLTIPAEKTGFTRQLVEEEGVRGYLSVPLLYEGQALGVLSFYTEEPRLFARTELGLVQLLAAQVTTAVENSRLYERERRRLREAEALAKMTKAVNSSLDQQEVLRTLGEQLLASLRARRCSIWLLEPRRELLWAHVVLGLDDPELISAVMSSPVRVDGTSLLSRAVREMRPAVANESIGPDEGLLNPEQAYTSLLALPLLARTELVGAVLVDYSGESHQLATKDIVLATTLLQQAAAAVANARLFDEVVHTRNELRIVLDSIDNGVFMVDRNLHVRFVNKRLAEFFGFALSPGKTLGRHKDIAIVSRLKQLVSDPRAFEIRLRHLYANLDREGYDEIVITPPTQQETLTLYRYIGPVRDDKGNLIGKIEVYSDITERKRLAQQTAANEALRQTDKLRSELLATVSHELRTPLASIKGYTSTLSNYFDRLSREERNDFMQIIDEESDKLSELIDNLLAMSELEAGVLRMNKNFLDLTGILRSTVEYMETRFPIDYRFRLTLPGNDLPHLLADGRRIRQVLQNLLENAVKYSPDGGSISVSLTSDKNGVMVRVKDEGIGIPAEHHERIFERFYQVDASSTRRAGGSGLGLAICRRLIEAHGGTIGVESIPGEGSTFFFTLPWPPSQEEILTS